MTNFKVNFRILELEARNIFRIDHFGQLSLKKPIDREEKSEYNFTIEILSNTFSLNDSAIVFIEVTDVNDNPPVFLSRDIRITINEDIKPGEILTRIIASDRDSGENGELSYYILSGNDHQIFKLDATSGVLIFTKWNDEVIEDDHEELIIIASDNGRISKWNWTRIIVVVDNDIFSATAPFFVVPQYQKSVPENQLADEVILKIRASNRIGRSEMDWKYRLRDNDEIFVCNETTGDILIRKQFDYENRSSYSFSLIVSDNTSRSAVVPVEIFVLGIDEFPPVFMKSSYIFEAPITTKVGQRIGVLMATDQDSGLDGIIRYAIEGDAMRYLTIDSDTGQLILKKELAEIAKEKNLTVDEFHIVASSGVSQHSRVKVTVKFVESTAYLSPSKSPYTIMLMLLSLLILLSILIMFVIKMWMRMRSHTAIKKQIYSVSKGNTAVMADLSRYSPSFQYDKQRIPLPKIPVTKIASSSSSSSISRYSAGSGSTQPKFNGQLLNGRSAPQSMPDSGIDPDDVSITSSVTDYLTQIGVTHNTIFDQRNGSNRSRLMHGKNTFYDSALNDLIYAKVDEILSPASRMNIPTNIGYSFDISSLNASISQIDQFKFSSVPSFEPIKDLLSRKTQANVK